MTNGRDAFYELYGFIESFEEDNMATVIDPMDTCAIALSDGTGIWENSLADELAHSDYSGACSYIPLANYIIDDKEMLRSDFIPYHSAIKSDDPNGEVRNFLDWYMYKTTSTSYFDKVINNEQTPHVYLLDEFIIGPPHIEAVGQAFGFVDDSW